MPMRWFRVLLALLTGLLPAMESLPAHADALSACSFTMSEVAFGQVDVLPGTTINTNGTLAVRCPGITSLAGSTLYACISFPTPRRMLAGSNSLTYDFLGPLPATTTWSNSTPVQVPVSLLLNGGTATVTVPAVILAGQATAVPASYVMNGTASVAFGLVLGCSLSIYSTSFNFTVSATVLTACNVSAQNIDFGPTGPLASALYAQGQIRTQCSAGAPYSIGLDGGISGAADPTARRLQPASGPGSITYGLFRDSGRTLPWGNTTGTNVVAGVGNAATQSYPVYAQIPAQTTPAPGAYSDTVVVSVNY